MSKDRTPIWSGQTLTAGAGDTAGDWLDLRDAGARAALSLKITNGATGPTVPAQFQIQTANDYNAASPTLPVDFGGPLIGGTTNAGVYTWSVPLPAGIAAVRVLAGSNTDEDVTAGADLSEVK